MSEKKATRNAYGDALVALADRYPELIVLEADLAGATMTKGFKAAYPQRFFDMGIAESNMQGVAAGLSTCGFKPFTNTFAMFAAGRSWEQVRNSIAYPGMNVKVVGSHGGLSVGEDGATHQCLEDLAAMRSIPGMVVLSPCDANETRLMTKAMAAYDGPCFMRLGRLDVEECTNFVPGYRFEWGKATELYEGTDVTIIATGLMVQESLKARELLAQEGISAAVLDMHTIKPLDREAVIKAAEKTGCIVTAEEANILGGLGGAVAEVVTETCPVPVLRVGVKDIFGRSGDPYALLERYELTAKDVAAAARRAVAMKK